MANIRKSAKAGEEKKYIVLCKNETWVVGTKQDIIDDFNEDPEIYANNYDDINVYELSKPIPFSVTTPKIVL
jgi:hypothetical protein